MPQQYRKKPVVIEAVQYPGIGMSEGQQQQLLAHLDGCRWRQDDDGIAILTLEGEMKALPGDWIIKGVKGEFYPCKPEIFAATYEPADVLEPLAPPAKEG